MEKFYTPMEELLIEGAKALTTAEIVDAAMETKKDFTKALELDLMLLEAEAAVGLMDGLPVESD